MTQSENGAFTKVSQRGDPRQSTWEDRIQASSPLTQAAEVLEDQPYAKVRNDSGIKPGKRVLKAPNSQFQDGGLQATSSSKCGPYPTEQGSLGATEALPDWRRWPLWTMKGRSGKDPSKGTKGGKKINTLTVTFHCFRDSNTLAYLKTYH